MLRASRPPFIFGYDPRYVLDHQYYVAAIINFVGAILLQSNVYIILRKLKHIHFSVTLMVFGGIGALESFLLMMTLGDGCVPQCGHDRAMMVLIGLLAFIGQFMLTVSLQVEEAGKVSIIRKSADILFAFAFQILLFKVSVECQTAPVRLTDLLSASPGDLEHHRSRPRHGRRHHVQRQEDRGRAAAGSSSQGQVPRSLLQVRQHHGLSHGDGGEGKIVNFSIELETMITCCQ